MFELWSGKTSVADFALEFSIMATSSNWMLARSVQPSKALVSQDYGQSQGKLISLAISLNQLAEELCRHFLQEKAMKIEM